MLLLDTLASLKKTAGVEKVHSPYLALHISDVRGVDQEPRLSINDQELTVEAGSRLPSLPGGIQPPFDESLLTLGDMEVSLSLTLRGLGSMELLPLGDSSDLQLESDWPHPEFIGASLPGDRAINEYGFSERLQGGTLCFLRHQRPVSPLSDKTPYRQPLLTRNPKFMDTLSMPLVSREAIITPATMAIYKEIGMHTDEMEYAGFWVRVGASLIDTVLLLIVTGPILTLIYGESYWASESGVKGFWDLLFSYVLPAVAVIVFWVYKSATPGKMALRLKVVDANTGRQPSTARLVGRYFGYYVSAIPLCLGFIWVGIDSKKQGWHDKLAGTVVVRDLTSSTIP